jgi:hypothetical protein
MPPDAEVAAHDLTVTAAADLTLVEQAGEGRHFTRACAVAAQRSSSANFTRPERSQDLEARDQCRSSSSSSSAIASGFVGVLVSSA